MPWPDHLLSLAEWEQLPEDTSHRYELSEGVLLVVPRPLALHQRAMGRLMATLDEQLPDNLTALPDVEVIIEAGEAFGATKQQQLWKVELPAALPTIMAGLTQCIMLSLSMVVFAALIGAGGLGTEINRALGSRKIDLGLEAGLAIVVLAIVLDRMTRIGVGGKK